MSFRDAEKNGLDEVMAKVLRQGGLSGGLSMDFSDFIQRLPSEDNVRLGPDARFATWGNRMIVYPDGRVLRIGGAIVDGGVWPSSDSVEVFDPSVGTNGTWRAAASLPAARQEGDAMLLQRGPHAGKVLYIGGNDRSYAGDFFQNMTAASLKGDCYLYDIKTDSWTATGSLSGGAGVILSLPISNIVELHDGRVLIAGSGPNSTDGFGGGPPFAVGPVSSNKTYLWTPNTGVWAAGANLNTARSEAALALLNDGRALVVGGGAVFGFPPPFLSTVEIYDPSTDAWTQYTMPSITDADGTNEKASRDDDPVVKTVTGASRTMAGLHVLQDGRALIWGGWGVATENAAAHRSRRGCLFLNPGVLLSTGPDVYSPAYFTKAPNMVIAKTAGRLSGFIPDGRLMVVGGENDKDGFFNGKMATDVQFYDPVSNKWSLSAITMPTAGAQLNFATQGVVGAEGQFISVGSYKSNFSGPSNTSSILEPDPK
jgi:hypothetical protein